MTVDERDLIVVNQHTESAVPLVDAAPDTHSVQTAVEGLPPVEATEDDRPTIEFMGERFRIASKIGLMPLLKFAHVSRKGIDSADIEGLAAMYAMIRDCIDAEPSVRYEQDARTGERKPVYGPSEWDRFEDHANDTKADDTELFEVVTKVIEVISARPTGRRSDSSTGSQATSATSKESSALPGAPDGMGDLVPVGSLLAP